MEMREYLAAEDKQFRAHLEEHRAVIGGVLEEVKAQGDQIAQETAATVKASGKEAVAQAQASMGQVAQAAQATGDLAMKAAETAVAAVKRSEEALGRMDQASQRMVTSEAKVEAALDALVPKVAEARQKLEKDLTGMVTAAGGTEAEIQRMVAAIRTAMTNEIHTEIRKKLQDAASHATKRIYNVGDLWDRFLKSLVILFPLTVAAAGGLGWLFGQHYLEEGIYEKKFQELKRNVRVSAWGMKVQLDPAGHVLSTEAAPIHQILVPVGDGKTWEAMVRRGDDWYYRGQLVPDAKGFSIADAYDKSRKENNLIKDYQP